MTLEERAREWLDAIDCPNEAVDDDRTVVSLTALLQAVRDEALEEARLKARHIGNLSSTRDERDACVRAADAIRALKGTP